MTTLPQKGAGARPRVLIADDDPVVRMHLGMVMERHCDVVASVGDATAAIREAAATFPDAAIVDVDMPGGGAPSAVPGILAGSPGTAIVVLSGDESDKVVVELLTAGATTYVRKGISPHELAETVERSIRAHGSQPG
jgi:DNA-binding NarL/FixJ family response regulator